MENNSMTMDWSWIIGLLIIGGIVGGNGFFGNGSYNQVNNDFVYTNLSSQVRDNANGIAMTDRDVLENRYQNSLQTNVLQNQASVNALEMQGKLDSCCCTLRQEASANTQKIIDTITNNRIQELEYQLSQANTAVANAVQTQNILNNLGRYYPYGYGYYNGTTIV